MQSLLFIAMILTIYMPVSISCDCLPKEIDLKALIQESTPASVSQKRKPMTVDQKLVELKAKCKKGKLVDRNGREIRFVQLIGCWGNPPEDYQEQLDNQAREIKQLQEKFTVIQIPCANGRDVPIIN